MVYTIYLMYDREKCTLFSEFVYVGKTSGTLKERFRYHTKDAMKPGKTKAKVYRYMAEVGPDKFDIKPLQLIEDKQEASLPETFWFVFLNPGLNANTPGGWTLYGCERAYQKWYYKARHEANREETLKKRRGEKTHCELCNCEIRREKRLRHTRTQKHQKALSLQTT